jgi:aspartyl aminopeptidase
MAHAVHPNYLDRFEPSHHVHPNQGPVIKTNVGQRYATDAATAAEFIAACERANVPWQVYSHRSNMACGSTIGPITAMRLGIATVDVGNPMLSMHSAREMAGRDDSGYMVEALTEVLRGE